MRVACVFFFGVLTSCSSSAEAPANCSSSLVEAFGVPPRNSCQPPGGTTRWFSLHTWKLGVTNKTTGKVDSAAWMDFGWDLDNRLTTAEDSLNSTSSCKRAPGSPTKVLMDGNLARDNNFGQHVVPLAPDYEVTVNSLNQRTVMFLELENFTVADNTNVPGTLHVGDVVRPFRGYVSSGYWIGEAGITSLPGVITDIGTEVETFGATITMKTDGTDGTIVGALPAEALVGAADSLLRHAGVCVSDPKTKEQLIQTLGQSVDLSASAPEFQDTAQTCDAISIGIGFIAEPKSERPTPHSEPDPDPCMK
jgi:hypothetical protein